VNAVQSLMSGVFCIREPYYHADLNAIALSVHPRLDLPVGLNLLQ
jgi:hypothetical protein